jgi:hypothetical protein
MRKSNLYPNVTKKRRFIKKLIDAEQRENKNDRKTAIIQKSILLKNKVDLPEDLKEIDNFDFIQLNPDFILALCTLFWMAISFVFSGFKTVSRRRTCSVIS